MKFRIQISDLSKVTSYRSSKNEAVLLFSRLLIVASLIIMVLMKANCDTATRLGLIYQHVQGIDGRREAQTVKKGKNRRLR